ncbi:hypothetical protein OEA41_000182 [Lepraria neglecta]|uniref:DUF7923 domain-containing protein n=1 Tax=Lepraria neglecta TaxID=209136 RepID=A0AAD9ZG01_9LECA|nr:hypothetical protein OEA41_000182 [Lepraria neglecta]
MAATSKGGPTGDYRQRLSYFKDTDAEKNEMVNELIENLENARKECRQISLDLESERAERRRHQGRVEELETLTRGRGFVLVLIDADADDYIFRERFLNKDDGGGKGAADELHARIKDYLKELKLDADNTKIVVRAYADVKNLQATCVKNGKMKRGSSLNLFARSFNQRQGLFDFVDIGAGKEEADNKIRECLSFYLDNWQCKHVVFGACHDSGYAPYLGQFAADPLKRDRITLLQGVTIHPRIAALGFRYTLKLDSSLIDDIINAVNIIIYQVVEGLETGLLHIPPRELGFRADHSSTSLSTQDASNGSTEPPDPTAEIENGVHRLETLLEATNLQLPLSPSAPTPESILLLRRKLQETRKLNQALRSTHNQNAALVTKLSSLLSPPTTSTQSDPSSLAFLASPTNPAAQTLNLSFAPSSKDSKPRTTNAQFATSQLPALRQLVAELRPKMQSLKDGARDKVDWESRREERRAYIEAGTKNVVIRRGTVEGEEFGGGRRGRVEVEELEGVVRGLERGETMEK